MAALSPYRNSSSTLLSDTPMNLSHCNTPCKLSFWITHLPYYQSYISYQENKPTNSEQVYSSVIVSETLYKVKESDLVITEQIGKILYENWISGHLLHSNDTFNRNDYIELLECNNNIANMEHAMVHYVWGMIHKSQEFYKVPGTNDRTYWRSDTYQRYCACYINHIEQHCTVITIKRNDSFMTPAADQRDKSSSSKYAPPSLNSIVSSQINVFNTQLNRQYTQPLFISTTSEEYFDTIAATLQD
eukprot:1125494_1